MRRVVVAALLAVGCVSPKAPDPAGAPARVLIRTAAGAVHAVTVELARTEQERARGLMHRESLPPGTGMLFLFDETSVRVFWMKNTPLPLDMIFVDEEGTIVGIVEGAEPRTETPRGVGVPSRYVLEVIGGWSRANGVRPGDRARFENVPRF